MEGLASTIPSVGSRWPGPSTVSLHNIKNIQSWADGRRQWLENMLVEHGAILFEGLPVESPAKFQQTATALCGRLLDYMYRSTPRTSVGEKIYTATEYRADSSIPLHNENAYQRDWPMKLVFCCLQPASTGGETPLVLTRDVTRRIDPTVLRTFCERGVEYVRNYRRSIDIPWETTFQTRSKLDVEAYCRRHGIECEWLPDDGLRTRQVTHATARHPVTGELLWFNQAHLFHVSSLPAAHRDALLNVYGEADLPRNAHFGDGSRIDEGILNHIRQAYNGETFIRQWRKGDILLLDNMLVAHGRQPFTGQRQILVAMGDAFSKRQRPTELESSLR